MCECRDGMTFISVSEKSENKLLYDSEIKRKLSTSL